MNDTPIINVLNYKENYIDYKFISKDLNIINTLDLFHNESEKRNKIESLLNSNQLKEEIKNINLKEIKKYYKA